MSSLPRLTRNIRLVIDLRERARRRLICSEWLDGEHWRTAARDEYGLLGYRINPDQHNERWGQLIGGRTASLWTKMPKPSKRRQPTAVVPMQTSSGWWSMVATAEPKWSSPSLAGNLTGEEDVPVLGWKRIILNVNWRICSDEALALNTESWTNLEPNLCKYTFKIKMP